MTYDNNNTGILLGDKQEIRASAVTTIGQW